MCNIDVSQQGNLTLVGDVTSKHRNECWETFSVFFTFLYFILGVCAFNVFVFIKGTSKVPSVNDIEHEWFIDIYLR